MSRWLVTGGAGFIGSHMVETLLQRGEKVRVIDDFSHGKKENIASVLNSIELIRGDIRDPAAVRKAMSRVDYVLHIAALRSVPRSLEIPIETNSVNVEGTLNCLMAAQKARVKRFVFASSSSIYGNTDKFPQVETDPPAPVSPYAVSKLAGEYYLRMFTESCGLSTVSLRFFNVFGPRQDPKSKYAAVVPKFIIAALKNEPLEVHWDGAQSRDFTHVSNVVEAALLAARTPRVRQPVYNVACGTSTSLLDIAAILEEIMGKKLKKKFTPKRAGDVRKTFADISPIHRDMGFRPAVAIREGIRDTFAYFSRQKRI